MESYSALISNGIIIDATIWISRESMLSERSQLEENMYHMIPLICNVQDRQIHRPRKQTDGCQGLGVERNGD